MTTKVKPPNIVIFNPDQWRGDVTGHPGNPAAITPIRCSFITWWYPHTGYAPEKTGQR